MTSVKRNDFGEGLLDQNTGHKLTLKNLETSEYARFDGDSPTIIKLQKKILEYFLLQPYYEVWTKPTEENGLKYGRYSPAEKNWYKCTIKDIESATYLQLYIRKEHMLEIFEEFGLKPNWAKFTK